MMEPLSETVVDSPTLSGSNQGFFKAGNYVLIHIQFPLIIRLLFGVLQRQVMMRFSFREIC